MITRFIRRTLMGLGALSLISLVLSLFMLLHHPSIPAHNVLHVVLDGPIAEAPDRQMNALLAGEHSLPLATLTHRIRAAAQDKRIDGLLLQVKAPEIGLAQLEELSRAMAAFRASAKWTASYMETAGEGSRGDGAYALATMANQVILAPPGEINLMGMRTDSPFGKAALAKLHVQAHVEQRYEYKNFAEMFTETGFTSAHKESVVSLLDDLQARMTEIVAEARHTTPAQVLKWIHTAPYSSQAALSAHLVDQVAYWDEVENAAKKVTGGSEEPFLDVADYEPKAPRNRDTVTVAMVVGAGEIDRGPGAKRPVGGSDHMGSDVYTEALRQARADGVRGVLLRIDSPGGSYIASDLIRREVQLTRDQNIPVVVSMGNVAASGGYFMAIEADHIVAEPGTITGSIGVVSVSFALRKTLQDFLGITFDSYAAADAPGATDFLDPMAGEGLARMRSDVDRIYIDFVSKVAQGRHMSYDKVHASAKGRVWTGRQALALGLVDEMGGIDTAMAYLKRRLDVNENAPVKLIYYPEPQTPWTMLLELAGGQIRASHMLQTLAPYASEILKQVHHLQQTGVRAQWDSAGMNPL